MKRSSRYQAAAVNVHVLRRWLGRLLHDFGNGMLTEDKVRHRVQLFLAETNPQQKARLHKELSEVMRQMVAGMKLVREEMEIRK